MALRMDRTNTFQRPTPQTGVFKPFRYLYPFLFHIQTFEMRNKLGMTCLCLRLMSVSYSNYFYNGKMTVSYIIIRISRKASLKR